MTLQDLIDLLAGATALNPDAELWYSDGTAPGSLYSWRGAYSELTLVPDVYSSTVAAFHEYALRDVLNRPFEGYKGGYYTMTGSTAVWADEYGDYSRYAIIGKPKYTPKALILPRVQIPWEYS